MEKGVPIDPVQFDAELRATVEASRRWFDGNGPRPDQFFIDSTVENREDLQKKKKPFSLPVLISKFDDTRKAVQLSEKFNETFAEIRALGRTVADLQPKAKVGAKVIGGARTRGDAIAKTQADLYAQWKIDLGAHYAKHPLARHVSYRTEADRLLNRGVRVTWTTDTPGYDLLRKNLLPPLLRKLFPRLYS